MHNNANGESQMLPIDVTGLTERQINELERNPSGLNIGSDGIAHPDARPKHARASKEVIHVKDCDKNVSLVKRFGDKIFNDQGKLNYKAFPAEELLKRMVRRKGDSRENLFEQLGKPYMSRLLTRIPKSELKLKTKKVLKNNIRKFLGLGVEKTHKQKSKDKKAKSEKRSDKMDVPNIKE